VEINPMIVLQEGEGVVAVDALMQVGDPDQTGTR
jgi:succinyl-CoA synthetase beta subunit